MSADVRHCPGCGSDQRGEEIPAHTRAYYGNTATHYWRTVMVEIPGVYDGGLFFQCPDCDRRWHRWPETDWRHVKAAPFVAGAR